MYFPFGKYMTGLHASNPAQPAAAHGPRRSQINATTSALIRQGCALGGFARKY